MNPDFIFALYVFCMNYHSGQWSRGYRILSRISLRYRPSLPDSAWNAIQGNRHAKREIMPLAQYGHWTAQARKQACTRSWDEWEQARTFYRQLKRKYAGKV